jgi:hypothetical protein
LANSKRNSKKPGEFGVFFPIKSFGAFSKLFFFYTKVVEFCQKKDWMEHQKFER